MLRILIPAAIEEDEGKNCSLGCRAGRSNRIVCAGGRAHGCPPPAATASVRQLNQPRQPG